MDKVDFAIIGAQKSGTTSLAYQLSQHPEVVISKEKEPHFFSKRDDWQGALDEYHQLFSHKPGRCFGEASTSYSFYDEYPKAAARLAQYNPALKLIYLLRHPVDRMESHYNHRLRNGAASRRPLKALSGDPAYIQRSRYFYQLRSYLEHFPKEQLLVLLFEEYTADPLGHLARISEFLNISPEPLAQADLTPKNVSDVSVKLKSASVLRAFSGALAHLPGAGRLARHVPVKYRFSNELRDLLWKTVEDDMQRLEQWMARPLPWSP